MDYKKDNPNYDFEKRIYYSQTVKAGKRIYYLDVKKSKRDELFLSITESKKVYTGEGEEGQYNFEKHKIFLYKEDFSKFIDALSNAIRFIHENGEFPAEPEAEPYDEEPGNDADAPVDAPPAVQAQNQTAPDETAAEIIDDIDLKIDF